MAMGTLLIGNFTDGASVNGSVRSSLAINQRSLKGRGMVRRWRQNDYYSEETLPKYEVDLRSKWSLVPHNSNLAPFRRCIILLPLSSFMYPRTRPNPAILHWYPSYDYSVEHWRFLVTCVLRTFIGMTIGTREYRSKEASNVDWVVMTLLMKRRVRSSWDFPRNWQNTNICTE